MGAHVTLRDLALTASVCGRNTLIVTSSRHENLRRGMRIACELQFVCVTGIAAVEEEVGTGAGGKGE